MLRQTEGGCRGGGREVWWAQAGCQEAQQQRKTRALFCPPRPSLCLDCSIVEPLQVQGDVSGQGTRAGRLQWGRDDAGLPQARWEPRTALLTGASPMNRNLWLILEVVHGFYTCRLSQHQSPRPRGGAEASGGDWCCALEGVLRPARFGQETLRLPIWGNNWKLHL